MSRLRGNALFKCSQFDEAISAYTEALGEECKDEGDGATVAASRAVIFSNRSACYLNLCRYEESAQDARSALALNDQLEKAYYRLAMSLKGLLNINEALQTIQQGLEACPDSESLLKLRISMSKTAAAADKKKNASKHGFLNRSSSISGGDGAHPDSCNCGASISSASSSSVSGSSKMEYCKTCEVSTSTKPRKKKQVPSNDGAIIIETAEKTSYTDSEYNILISLRTLIKNIKNGDYVPERADDHNLQGTFKQLCNQQQCLDLLYPGVPRATLQGLPKTLRELLLWRELVIDLTFTAKSAAGVLEGIKRKGAALGNVLDQETERVLLPQIVQEALARELVTAVRRLAKQISQVSARTTLALASPSLAQATLDQLDQGVPEELCGEKMLAVQSEFLGDEWASLVLDDVIRFAANERMSEYGAQSSLFMPSHGGSIDISPSSAASSVFSVSNATHPRMAWVELGEGTMRELYPALAEAISKLHSLPFELNAKLDCRLQLLEPAPGCTLLFHYPDGAEQPLRLDNRIEAQNDSGIRMTCVYHLVPGISVDATSGGERCTVSHFLHQIHDSNDATEKSFPVENDQLCMFQSTRVKNGKTKCLGEYFAILFLSHAKMEDA